MSNIGGQALDYIKGLGGGIRSYMGANVGLGERIGNAAFTHMRSLMSNPYAYRTGLGALGGGLAGGIFGGQKGSGFSFSGAAMGAGLGAAGVRYGGSFMNAGMRSGVGLRSAAMRTMALGRSDFRMAMMQGRSARSFIGKTMTSGFSRIQGLGR
jgi:hypothetical protein